MIIMVFWMSIAAGLIIGLDSLFEIPDEVSGVAYFICIGIAASGTLNYYKWVGKPQIFLVNGRLLVEMRGCKKSLECC